MFENIDRRKLIIYGLIALLVIIVALILWWLFGPKAQAPTAVAPPTQPEAINQVSPAAPLPPVTAQRIQEVNSYPLGLKQLAMAFAERFGSYSTDEPVKNMADLAPFMTDNFKNSSALQTNLESPGIFSGFSTKALTSNLISINSSAATVVVKTQRTQTMGSATAVKTFYADLELKAVKSGNDWKIDGAKWQ